MIRWALYLSFLGFCLTRCLEAPTEPQEPQEPPEIDTTTVPVCYPDIKPPKL